MHQIKNNLSHLDVKEKDINLKKNISKNKLQK